MSTKPAAPKGMRDFLPGEMFRRKYIFKIIEKVFQKYGFLPLETPAMEQLSTLTGKYGEEGDQLMFRVLNSGDFLKDIKETDIQSGYKKVSPVIAEKALRYDLTIPFARVVATHQQALHFPFRRYQIQAVWRADRPQKGRYREFYQCDADIVGSDSLMLEAELCSVYSEVFNELKLSPVFICLNSRKILAGIAEIMGAPDRLTELCVALDKRDKIGKEGVEKELKAQEFTETQIQKLFSLDVLFQDNPNPADNLSRLHNMKEALTESSVGMKGIGELFKTYNYLQALQSEALKSILFDFTLARGLNYYTGVIMEVRMPEVHMGSIGGGGRYDDLTGMFGVNGMSGVGISFGADRIYDVLEMLNLFPEHLDSPVAALITNFGTLTRAQNLGLLARLRALQIPIEYYPDEKKLPRQIEYAVKKRIPYLIIQGETEIKDGICMLKDLNEGTQIPVKEDELIQRLQDLYK